MHMHLLQAEWMLISHSSCATTTGPHPHSPAVTTATSTIRDCFPHMLFKRAALIGTPRASKVPVELLVCLLQVC